MYGCSDMIPDVSPACCSLATDVKQKIFKVIFKRFGRKFQIKVKAKTFGDAEQKVINMKYPFATEWTKIIDPKTNFEREARIEYINENTFTFRLRPPQIRVYYSPFLDFLMSDKPKTVTHFRGLRDTIK